MKTLKDELKDLAIGGLGLSLIFAIALGIGKCGEKNRVPLDKTSGIVNLEGVNAIVDYSRGIISYSVLDSEKRRVVNMADYRLNGTLDEVCVFNSYEEKCFYGEELEQWEHDFIRVRQSISPEEFVPYKGRDKSRG